MICVGMCMFCRQESRNPRDYHSLPYGKESLSAYQPSLRADMQQQKTTRTDKPSHTGYREVCTITEIYILTIACHSICVTFTSRNYRYEQERKLGKFFLVCL